MGSLCNYRWKLCHSAHHVIISLHASVLGMYKFEFKTSCAQFVNNEAKKYLSLYFKIQTGYREKNAFSAFTSWVSLSDPQAELKLRGHMPSTS